MAKRVGYRCWLRDESGGTLLFVIFSMLILLGLCHRFRLPTCHQERVAEYRRRRRFGRCPAVGAFIPGHAS